MSNIETTKSVTNYDFEIPSDLDDQGVYEFVLPKIEASWNKAKDSIFETGKWLSQARDRTDHGNWGDFVETLPFGTSTAEKLRLIAECETFGDPKVYKKLPNSWGTLDELRMRVEEGEEAFLKVFQNGKIKSDMTRENAKFLFGKPASSDGVYLKAMSEEKMKKLLKDDRLFEYRTQLVDELKRVDELLASDIEEAA